MTRAVQILLVEDSPSDARLTQLALESAELDCRVEIAEDGESALSRLRDPDAPRPDLILLDLNLPGIDGHEVLGELKSDDALSLIPVCVLTTSRAPEDVDLAYRRHTNCYIAKPFDMDEFAEVIRQLETFWFQVAELPGSRAHDAA
ncbi:MAG: response regulator [Myxococcota bacterium]|nr:response regulator [Myxococcota bacterium]